MRIGRREMRRRLTGLTLPSILGTGGGGATWTVEAGDKSRADSILRYLEDRRVLYAPYEVEIPHRCVASVREIRAHLRSVIEQCQSRELRDPLRAIQASCRQFLTYAEAIGDRNGRIDVVGGGSDSWLFNQILGSLRARVGVSVAVVIETFDVDVDQHLAKLLPPPVDNDNDEPGHHERQLSPPGDQGML